MILKQVKKSGTTGKIVGGLIILEAAAFGVSYFVWSKLNKNRDLRAKTRDAAPWALELYYKMGETISDDNKAIRIEDERHWARAARVAAIKSD